MHFIYVWVFWNIIGLVERTWSVESDLSCYTANAKQGRCVNINNCPKLRKIAFKPAVSKGDQQYLAAHICAEQKVCCESPDDDKPVVQSTTTKVIVREKPNLPDKNDCGLDSASHRIVGGEETEKEQFRWTVALEYNMKNNRLSGVKCGGSLINTKYVITAAHCVDNVAVDELNLRLGEWDLLNNPDCDYDSDDCNPDVVNASVSKIIKHPKYRKQRNDIALLRLSEALPEMYTTHILPICLPTSPEMRKDLYAEELVSAVGWGGTKATASMSQLKMYAALKTMSLVKCAGELRDLNVSLRTSHICARSANNIIRDTCGGDSGGPLQIQREGNYYLIGIVSFGPPCGTTLLPAVYTRVTAYLDWILKNIVD